ncbi:hypothetical protein M407DRAFT_25244 [Tulasnella calospora MUT 4182]|uniref:Retrotransposon gag domain-containing protein n=1 Tax=Tulasnella calospora MUT 4182 TaxID=1051891 RepID=A0A0C3QGI2_9AGAM|nr:hypothetical protein M407DRAFT_25244 [Tulasnella calospora MUT 4182]
MDTTPIEPNWSSMDNAAVLSTMQSMWGQMRSLTTQLTTARADLQDANDNYNQLLRQHQALQSTVQQATLNPQVRVTAPVNVQDARTFIQSCTLYFLLKATDFPDEAARIRFVLMLLQDKAARWAQPIVSEALGTTMTLRTTLVQQKSTAEYASEFREIVTILGWTEEAQLKRTFYVGLKPHVKDELAKVETPTLLVDYISLPKLESPTRKERGRARNTTSAQAYA